MLFLTGAPLGCQRLTAAPVVAILGSSRPSDYGAEMARAWRAASRARGVTVAAGCRDEPRGGGHDRRAARLGRRASRCSGDGLGVPAAARRASPATRTCARRLRGLGAAARAPRAQLRSDRRRARRSWRWPTLASWSRRATARPSCAGAAIARSLGRVRGGRARSRHLAPLGGAARAAARRRPPGARPRGRARAALCRSTRASAAAPTAGRRHRCRARLRRCSSGSGAGLRHGRAALPRSARDPGDVLRGAERAGAAGAAAAAAGRAATSRAPSPSSVESVRPGPVENPPCEAQASRALDAEPAPEMMDQLSSPEGLRAERLAGRRRCRRSADEEAPPPRGGARAQRAERGPPAGWRCAAKAAGPTLAGRPCAAASSTSACSPPRPLSPTGWPARTPEAGLEAGPRSLGALRPGSPRTAPRR